MSNSKDISPVLLKFLSKYNAYITTFEDKNTERFFIKVECTIDSQSCSKEFKYDYEKYVFKKTYYAKEYLIDYLNSINCNRNDKYNINNLKGILKNNPFPLDSTLLKISNKNLFYGQLDDDFDIESNNPIKSIYYNIDLNNYAINSEDPLIHIDYPFFPNCLLAFRNIMELDISIIPNGILFLIPLHQNYFKEIELTKTCINIKLNDNVSKEKIVICYIVFLIIYLIIAY